MFCLFASFHNLASVSAWFSLSKNCNRKCQEDMGVFSISSLHHGRKAGKLHCHINTQARYMMYEEISPGLRN